jgi:hypothetical protein
VHWFEYLDQPVTGRLLDGENGHVGLVGITDVPFQGFVEAVRKSNVQVPVMLSKEAGAREAESAKSQVAAQNAGKGDGGKHGNGEGKGAEGAGGHAGGTR